jgi:hypothetical protein
MQQVDRCRPLQAGEDGIGPDQVLRTSVRREIDLYSGLKLMALSTAPTRS